MKACAILLLQININLLGLLLIMQAKPKLQCHRIMARNLGFFYSLAEVNRKYWPCITKTKAETDCKT